MAAPTATRLYRAFLVVVTVLVALLGLRFADRLRSGQRHDAWRGCRARLRLGEPERCSFLHLCANEAPLTTAERALLLRRIRATPGCADP